MIELNAARIAAVIALVQIAKGFGLPGQWAGTAAMVVGAVLYVAGEALPQLNIVLIGLAAAGIYTIADTMSTRLGV